MEKIARFLKEHPLDKGTFEKVPQEMQDKYAGIVPASIMDIWQTAGFCSLGKGFVSMVNPDELKMVVERLGTNFDGAVPFLKTGIGGIFFLLHEENYFFSPVTMIAISYDKGPFETIMNYALTDQQTLDKLFFRDLYFNALPRLGQAGVDECFAFAPAIALGGDVIADNLQRVKLKEHLDFLTQLV
jgi:hypothetical protein